MNQFSVGGVLSKSFSIWLKNLIPFTILSLIMMSPLVIYSFIALSGEITLSSLVTYGIVMMVLAIVLGQVTTAAMTYGVFQQMRGQHAGLGACVAVGLKRALPVIAVGLLAGLLVGLGMLALVIPGIILSLMFYVAAPVAIVERPGIIASLKRSADLTKGYKGSIFGIVLVLGIINWIIGKIIESATIEQGNFDTFKTYMIVNLLWTIFWSALTATAGAVVYHDLRVSKEGVASDELAKVFD